MSPPFDDSVGQVESRVDPPNRLGSSQLPRSSALIKPVDHKRSHLTRPGKSVYPGTALPKGKYIHDLFVVVCSSNLFVILGGPNLFVHPITATCDDKAEEALFMDILS